MVPSTDLIASQFFKYTQLADSSFLLPDVLKKKCIDIFLK